MKRATFEVALFDYIYSESFRYQNLSGVLSGDTSNIIQSLTKLFIDINRQCDILVMDIRS